MRLKVPLKLYFSANHILHQMQQSNILADPFQKKFLNCGMKNPNILEKYRFGTKLGRTLPRHNRISLCHSRMKILFGEAIFGNLFVSRSELNRHSD